MQKEITALKNKLPRKGYVALIIQSMTENKLNPVVTKDVIKNYFEGRSVSSDKKIVIVKSAKLAVEKLKQSEAELKALLTE